MKKRSSDRCGTSSSTPAGAGQIVLDRFGVLAAHAAVEGMRVRAEADVRLQRPILQIVPRFEARPREIGDLVARDSQRRQAFDGEFVEIGGGVVGGRIEGAVAHAAEQHFLAEAAVLVHFEHVDGDVLRGEALHPVERLAPGGFGLAGKSGDQVDVDIAYAGGAQHRNLGGDDLRGVRASGAAEFLFDERLHAERDALDAGSGPGAGGFRRDVAGSGFDGGFRPGASGDEIEQRAQRIGGEIARGAAAQVDRVGSPVPGVGADLRRQRVAVAQLEVARENAAGEIAVGTLLRAERDRRCRRLTR